jgi:hypothetical protein
MKLTLPALSIALVSIAACAAHATDPGPSSPLASSPATKPASPADPAPAHPAEAPAASTTSEEPEPPAQPAIPFRTLPPAVVLKSMKPSTTKVRACYDAGYKEDPSIAGEVKIRFVVDEDGKVTESGDGGSTVPAEGVIQCVAKVVENVRFPKPEAGGSAIGIYSVHFGD